MKTPKPETEPNSTTSCPSNPARWVGADGRVVQFGKPYGDLVKALRRHPDGTGYIRRPRRKRVVVLTVERSDHKLLTSDRPVLYSNLFGRPDTNLAVPIGQRHLFLAV